MHQGASAALVLAIGLLLAGCAQSPGETGQLETTRSEQLVIEQVERRDIVDAIVMAGLVRSGSVYSVTNPTAGSLQQRDGEYLIVTADGVEVPLVIPDTAITVTPLTPLGVQLPKNLPILQVQDAAFLFAFQLTPAEVMRLADRMPRASTAQIEGSEAPFDCPLVDQQPTYSDGAYSIYCRIPLEVLAVDGASGLALLKLEERANVLSLPIEAVAGTLETGSVYLEAQPDVPIAVKLGITDGVYVEILAGLAEGDRVVVPSPSILGD